MGETGWQCSVMEWLHNVIQGGAVLSSPPRRFDNYSQLASGDNSNDCCLDLPSGDSSDPNNCRYAVLSAEFKGVIQWNWSASLIAAQGVQCKQSDLAPYNT